VHQIHFIIRNAKQNSFINANAILFFIPPVPTIRFASSTWDDDVDVRLQRLRYADRDEARVTRSNKESG
jgi:hypothetical protein